MPLLRMKHTEGQAVTNGRHTAYHQAHDKIPAIDAVMNADDDLALVTEDPSLGAVTAVSYRRRDGRLLGHLADGSTRSLGHLAKPMIGRLQGCDEVLLVIEQADDLPVETTVPLNRHP